MNKLLAYLVILCTLLSYINAYGPVYNCHGSRQVALTFDDGPHSGATDHVLDVLRDHGVKATFFILGRNLVKEGGRSLLKRIYREGHAIGTHSWNHEYMSGMSKAEVKEEITKTIDKIYEIIGIRPRIFRPPYGDISEHMYSYADKVVMWSFDTGDWQLNNGGTSVSSVVNTVKDEFSNSPNGPILLMHDACYDNGEVLKKIIPLIKKKGYRFVTLD